MIDFYFLDIETLSIFSRDHILHLAARSRQSPCLRVIFSLNVTQEIPIIISGKNTKKTKWTVLKALIPVHCMKSISITFGFYHLSAGHQLQFPRGRLDKGLLQQQNILSHRQSWAGGGTQNKTNIICFPGWTLFGKFSGALEVLQLVECAAWTVWANGSWRGDLII